MGPLLALARGIDRMTAAIGRAASWLILASVLVSAINAIVRKSLDLSSNAWLEVQWYLFGAVFMLCAAWTLSRREHIRIDIVAKELPVRLRQWITLAGHVLFLMPFSLFMIGLTWVYFGRSVVNGGEWDLTAGFFGKFGLVVSRIIEDTTRALGGAGETRWEYSNSAGGLIVWPAILMILLGFMLLAIQGISEIIKQIAIMRGMLPDPETPKSEMAGTP